MLLDRYPQEVKLEDGAPLILRAMNRQDERALIDFFDDLREEDRLYMRNDVTNSRVIREWFGTLNYNRVFPLLAVHEKRIVANATLHRKPFGWMRHLGEVRIVVSPDFRKRGLARIMFNELIKSAAEAGLEKLTAELAVTQKGASEMFRKVGFKDEAVLKNYIRDARDETHDLLVMTLDVK